MSLQAAARREAMKAAARRTCENRPMGHRYKRTSETGTFPDGLEYVVYGCRDCTARKVMPKCES